MSCPPNYTERLLSFAHSLRDDAAALDRDPACVADHWSRFIREGLHTQTVAGAAFYTALSTLAQESGAFAFLALQQYVANFDTPAAGPHRTAGVAFGHLRNPSGPAPLWNGRTASGTVPWFTGAGIFEQALLGVRGEDGSERYAWVDATDRPEFRHSPVFSLVAATGAATVSVTVRELPLADADFLRVDPPGTRAEGDAAGVLYQTPLLAGCVRAARNLIAQCDSVASLRRDRALSTADALLDRTEAAFAAPDPTQGRPLRAALGDLAVRLARLAAMGSGGRSLSLDHPAQRLYREALLYSLMAQTETIVGDAFDGVFP